MRTSVSSTRHRLPGGAARLLPVLFLVALPLLLPAAGCSKAVQLMPTPNVYTTGDLNPFENVPEAHRHNRAEVMYVTDRLPEGDGPDWKKYGYKRSRSIAYGVADVRFGKDVSWDELVQESLTAKRKKKLEVLIEGSRELGRFPPTPKHLVEPGWQPAATQPVTRPTAPDEEQKRVEQAFHRELAERLANTPVKEVYVFIHGYNNTFQDAVSTIAQLWHFFGRDGVPVAYSWPAGMGGLLRGYTYDRESSEFTVYHLKEMLEVIAACPEVKKVHIIAHSRGTDVTSNALRELHLEIAASGRVTREVLKLGTVVLAAPDMDLDVVIQRSVTARLGRVPERFALYVCSKDKALGVSNWLFSGALRLGQLRSNIFTPEELAQMRASKTLQIIDARVTKLGAFNHGYFHASPAVSSDLVMLVRYQRPPGPENGRPLRADPNGFWVIDDTYPAPTHAGATQAASQ